MAKVQYDLILTLDIGKDTTKAIGRLYKDKKEVKATRNITDLKFSIPTKCDLVDKEAPVSDSDSSVVKYNNKTYLVGQEATTLSDGTSKINEIHEIAGIKAITHFMEEGTSCDVYMTLTSPLTHFTNDEYLNKYSEFFKKKNNKALSVVVDGKNYNINVKEISSLPEGSGVLLEYSASLKGKDVLLIDLGGMNGAATLYSNLKTNKNLRVITEFGNKKLENMISEAIIKNSGTPNTPSDFVIKKAIRNGYITVMGKIDSNSKKYINDTKEEYLDKFLKEIQKEKGLDYTSVDSMMFIGGTSLNLEKQIDKFEHATLSKNPQWDSVIGLYYWTVKKYKTLIGIK